MKRLLFLFAFLIAGLCAFAQAPDMIIQKNGGKIRCRILDQDSATIYYSLGEQKTLYSIKKADVEEYYISSKVPAAKDNYNKKPDAGPSSSGSLPSLAYANTDEQFILSITTGLANPIGDFAKKDAQDSTSGLAQLGYLLQGGLTIKVSHFMGVGVSYKFQGHPFDADALNEQLMQNLRQQVGNVPANVGFSTTAGSWIMAGPFASLFFTFPVSQSKNLSFDIDAGVGFLNVTNPEVTYSLQQNGISLLTFDQQKAKTWSVGYNMSFGLRYRFAEQIAFHCNLNVLTTKPYFKAIQASSTSPLPGIANQHYVTDYTQKILTVSLQVGLSFLIF